MTDERARIELGEIRRLIAELEREVRGNDDRPYVLHTLAKLGALRAKVEAIEARIPDVEGGGDVLG